MKLAGAMTLMAALAGLPTWACADQPPLLTLVTALARQVPSGNYGNMPGVNLQAGTQPSDYSEGTLGKVQLTGPEHAGSSAVVHAFVNYKHPADALQAIWVNVPAIGKQPPSAEFQSLLQQELGATAKVELLADRCQWDGGLMGESVDKDTFLKVTLASGERMLVKAEWGRDSHNHPKTSDFIFSPDDNLESDLKLIKDMECKPGPATW